MKVWKLNDCEYVAAESFDDAELWYHREVGEPIEEWEEVQPSVTMNAAEEGEPPRTVTFQQRVEELRLSGEKFPAILAWGSYYD